MSVETLPIPGPTAQSSRAPVALITGVGLLTSLGRSVGETWDALLAGGFITDHARAAGEYDRRSSRVIQMARRAAQEALAEAGWDEDDYSTVVGTSKGSVERWLGGATPLRCEAGGQDGRFDVSGLGDVAVALGGNGPKMTVSAACASGLLALGRAMMMIRTGQARRALVVAAEASVHPLFLGSFRRLGVLARDGVGCRPFDELRNGFLMSEAAAAVCLEAQGANADELKASGPSPMAAGLAWGVVVDRFAQGADATHLTAADPDGRVLRHLINKVLPRQGVDLVHAHGTGTDANDPAELAAIEAALADSSAAVPAPCLYSHKGALGHSLGAAGLVAVVLNVLAHRRGVVPPNVRTTQPLPARRVTIAPDACVRPVRRSLALAAGFGGAVAAVGLRSCGLA
jgi:3-oxoacyl-[acyl-carrier-protein] synthase II